MESELLQNINKAIRDTLFLISAEKNNRKLNSLCIGLNDLKFYISEENKVGVINTLNEISKSARGLNLETNIYHKALIMYVDEMCDMTKNIYNLSE